MSLAFFVTLIIIIVICSLAIICITKYNNISRTNLKINDAEVSIDENLRNMYDLIIKGINIIEKNTNAESKTLEEIKKIKSNQYSNFEVDRMLSKAHKELLRINDDYDKLSRNKNFKEIKDDLTNIEEKLTALRTFYNKYTSKYNLLLSTFPTNIIAKFGRYKQKTQYDGKNLNDDNIKDFKI